MYNETYVRNIISAWDALSADDVAKGRAWYSVAHDLAVMIGHGDAKKGAGIIAALSPLKSWHENIKLATEASSGNVRGHFANALAKVRAIADGTDPSEVLPMNLKTGNFYLNILNPEDDYAVTIDRHAYKVATGEAPKVGIKAKAYAEMADSYREAGVRLNELASVVQAGVWGPEARKGY